MERQCAHCGLKLPNQLKQPYPINIKFLPAVSEGINSSSGVKQSANTATLSNLNITVNLHEHGKLFPSKFMFAMLGSRSNMLSGMEVRRLLANVIVSMLVPTP